MNDNRVWATSHAGLKVHAFVQSSGDGRRAMCRANIVRGPMDVRHYDVRGDVYPSRICASCDKKFNEMIAREEASMAPSQIVDPQSYAEHFSEDDTTAESGQCCDHESMYHGARGCCECRCNTPRQREADYDDCAGCGRLVPIVYRNYQNVAFCGPCVAKHDKPVIDMDVLHAEALDMDLTETIKAWNETPELARDFLRAGWNDDQADLAKAAWSVLYEVYTTDGLYPAVSQWLNDAWDGRNGWKVIEILSTMDRRGLFSTRNKRVLREQTRNSQSNAAQVIRNAVNLKF